MRLFFSKKCPRAFLALVAAKRLIAQLQHMFDSGVTVRFQ
jgi:hypothetical protein